MNNKLLTNNIGNIETKLRVLKLIDNDKLYCSSVGRISFQLTHKRKTINDPKFSRLRLVLQAGCPTIGGSGERYLKHQLRCPYPPTVIFRSNIPEPQTLLSLSHDSARTEKSPQKHLLNLAKDNLGFQMAPGSAATGGLFKFLRPSARPQSADITAAVGWGAAATTAALWLVQVISLI